MPNYVIAIPFFNKVCYNKYMESLSDGERKVVIITRLLSVAAIISVFAVATSIKKPVQNVISNDAELLKVAFLNDFSNTDSSDEVIAKDDDPEVPVTALPDEQKGNDESKENKSAETETKMETEAKVETGENAPSYTRTYTPAARQAQATTSTASTAASETPNPNYPSNYDAGSPYAGQVYVDGGEAPELHNPTYYEIPGGNPNVVVESEEPALVISQDSETKE